ncbi:M23 family metallopeptidase [Parerythrobacter jejuensis]|uniref:Peptidoglycan DD-metalloendopeptidase family protein n=1 Tax=Parerythrobacter jejuensis TaxID=795812 RepID=A0A845ASL0_9SPHN|nr:M23 family metallopeptidase [Parerythrobacter jejuensis]MXP31496.1 peptidoglycan DD-metalloendopeptidase family protein [Parerythrobacter jejuensis]
MRRAAFLILAAPVLLAAGNPRTATEYEVESGDTLGGISNRTGVPAAVIAAANGIPEPYSVQVGEVLVIPRQRNHTVKPGETGFAIALQYGVPFENIAIANGLDDDGTVRVGQKLIIPAVFTPRRVARRSIPGSPFFRRPHDGPVLYGFSKRPDGGGHDGIDIDVELGDMIRASASGTVVFADEEKTRFGRQVLIDHGNGWQTSYGHLARITVKKGDVVKTGERIGLAGQAGIATRPELHFEIRKDGEDVDPASKLPPRNK